MRHYTDEELIRRVTAIEEIKDLMSRRAMFNANDWRERELNELWVSDPYSRATASYGGNWGYYVGMDAISDWYVGEHAKTRQAQLDAACKNHPELENAAQNLGFGCMIAHPVSSPLVEIAGDGQSARGLWYSIGQESFINEDGTATALWVNDKLAADFLLEDGQWKIWHLVVANDVYMPAGQPIGEFPVYLKPEEDYVQKQFGTPTLPMTAHDPYYLWEDNYPAIPQPYETIDPKNSYAPEGHPAYPKGFVPFREEV